MEKTKTRNSGSRKEVVLVGTYRRDNEAWIADSRQYNLPLPNCGKTAFHGAVTQIVLIAPEGKPVAYEASFRAVVGREELKVSGCSLSYVNPTFHVRLDGELFSRCNAA